MLARNDVEDGHSSDELVASAGRATQHDKAMKALLVVSLLLAAFAGGAVAAGLGPGSGPSHTAAISESTELAAIGAKDFASFALRLSTLTKGKPWTEICTIYTQTQDPPSTVSSSYSQEVLDLATYFKATAADQPAIRALILTNVVNAGVSCWRKDPDASVEPVGAADLAGFTLRLNAITSGQPWTETCPIYNQILQTPGVANEIYLKETVELSKFYKATAADQSTIHTSVLTNALKAGVKCW